MTLTSEDLAPYPWPQLKQQSLPVLAGPRSSVAPAVEQAGERSTDPAVVLPEERRAAREQGYAEGLRQGREEAGAEQQVLHAHTQQAAAQFLLELDQEREYCRRVLQELVQALGNALATQVLEDAPELLDRLIDEAATELDLPLSGLDVEVAPELERWWLQNELRQDIKVQVNDSLAPGVVQLRARHRIARFDSQQLVSRLLPTAIEAVREDNRGLDSSVAPAGAEDSSTP